MYAYAPRQAETLLPPVVGKIYTRAIVASPGELMQVPNSWKNHWVNLLVVGNEEAFLLVSQNSISNMDPEALTAISGSGILTADTASPFPIPDRTLTPFYFGAEEHAFFRICGAAAGGRWYAMVSSPNVSGNSTP